VQASLPVHNAFSSQTKGVGLGVGTGAVGFGVGPGVGWFVGRGVVGRAVGADEVEGCEDTDCSVDGVEEREGADEIEGAKLGSDEG